MAEHIPPDRFAEYVDELHEFSGTHRVPCGKPEDLKQLVEALRNSELFATDFCSSIRSVVLREQCQVSESQLLTLVVVAWGGENADDSMDQLPSLVQKLRTILRGVPTGGASGLSTLSTDDSEGTPEFSSSFNDTIREIEEISPDVQLYRQLLKVQDKREERSGAEQDSVPIQRGVSAQHGQSGLSGSLDRSVSVRRLEPSGAEILALGLTGLVVALLFSVGSLPVYRARVSVYLPSSFAGASNPLANSRGLAERVAERLLPMPHQNPILRQDTVSRGMRDLHLGGSEPILYADLVAETAHQVTVRQLPSNNLYEITCDSWSPRFATTFCNELVEELDEQLGDALSSPRGVESGHIVDSAIDPGIQIYPHWYLQSLAGLAIGCLVGVSVGFVKRSPTQAVPEEEHGTL
jgi:hypothetical protein